MKEWKVKGKLVKIGEKLMLKLCFVHFIGSDWLSTDILWIKLYSELNWKPKNIEIDKLHVICYLFIFESQRL